MKRTWTVAVTVVAAMLFASGLPMAQTPGTPGKAPGGPASTAEQEAGAPPLPLEAPWVSLALSNAEALSLSADQREALVSLRKAYEALDAHHRESIGKAEADLQEILSAPRVDMNKVRTSLDAMGALYASRRLSRIESLVKGRAVLTPEQQSKLEGIVAAEHDAMMRRHRAPDQSGRTK